MIERLFRGKRTDNGEWVKGYYGVFKNTHQIFVPFTAEEEMENEGHFLSAIGGLWFAVIPESVGQYTGLTDYSNKNKQIFEGHIIQCRHEWHYNTIGDIELLFNEEVKEDNKDFFEQEIKGAYGKHTENGHLSKRYYYYRNYVVEWYAPNGRYRLRNKSVFYDLTSSFIINHECKVIGSLHDNPELLKGNEKKCT